MKALSLVLLAVSMLFSASLNGSVESFGNPVMSDVTVKLEVSGFSAVTDKYGMYSIRLNYAGTANHSKSITYQSPVTMHGNTIIINSNKSSSAEISVFNIQGKLITTLTKPISAGANSIVMNHKNMVCLYRVKIGNDVFVVKAHSAEVLQNSSIQNTSATLIDSISVIDTIRVEKDGYLLFRRPINVRVLADGVVAIPKIYMNRNAGDITDADGNVYQTVKVGEQTWMVGELMATKPDSSCPNTDPFVNRAYDSYDWMKYWTADSKSPAFCLPADSTKKYKGYGYLYSGEVVLRYRDSNCIIKGWRIPTIADWVKLRDYVDGTYSTQQIMSQFNPLGLTTSPSGPGNRVNYYGFSASNMICMPGGSQVGVGAYWAAGKTKASAVLYNGYCSPYDKFDGVNFTELTGGKLTEAAPGSPRKDRALLIRLIKN